MARTPPSPPLFQSEGAGTGLFANRGHSGGRAFAAYRARQKKAYPVGDKMDQLADALAEHDLETGDVGGDLRKAAAKIGVSYAYAAAMLSRMRKRLGEWAR